MRIAKYLEVTVKAPDNVRLTILFDPSIKWSVAVDGDRFSLLNICLLF